MLTLERVPLLVRCTDCGAVSGWTVLCFRCSGTDLELIELGRRDGGRDQARRMPHDDAEGTATPRNPPKWCQDTL